MEANVRNPCFCAMGCVYIDTCLTFCLGRSDYIQKKNACRIHRRIDDIFFAFFKENKSSILPRTSPCQARVSVNATHSKKSSFRNFRNFRKPTDLTENPYGKKPRSGKSNLWRTHAVKEMYTRLCERDSEGVPIASPRWYARGRRERPALT